MQISRTAKPIQLGKLIGGNITRVDLNVSAVYQLVLICKLKVWKELVLWVLSHFITVIELLETALKLQFKWEDWALDFKETIQTDYPVAST